MTIKTVIFDWDGTLVDSAEYIAECLHTASVSAGYPALSRKDYRNIIGLGMVEALNTLYPGIDKEGILAIRDVYSRQFNSRPTTEAHIFPGITQLLRDLADNGVGRAVATGKSRRGLDNALDSTGLRAHFQHSRCADETRSKPDPKMLRELLAVCGLQPNEAVMVGDTSYDLEMARRIGMPAIGVDWGVHDHAVLSRHAPLQIVASVAELDACLVELTQQQDG